MRFLIKDDYLSKPLSMSTITPSDRTYTITHFFKYTTLKIAQREFVSKKYHHSLDMSITNNLKILSFLSSYKFEKIPKGHKVDTILASDHFSNKFLVHIYTFLEPDAISQWKIYDIIIENF